MPHDAWIEEVITLAEDNVRAGRGGPFGALVVRGGEVIARATNRVTTDHDPTAHAEICAIRAACQALGTFQLDGCVLYASCEPCPMCLGAVYWARLDAVYYAADRRDAAEAGFDDAHIYDEVARPPAERSIPMQAVPTPGRRRPFEAWAAFGDRVDY